MARLSITSLQYELTELKAALAKAEASVKSTAEYRKWDQEARTKLQAELDQAHVMLDSIGCPLERKTKQEYSEIENPLAIRIGVWLAKKAGMV